MFCVCQDMLLCSPYMMAFNILISFLWRPTCKQKCQRQPYPTQLELECTCSVGALAMQCIKAKDCTINWIGMCVDSLLFRPELKHPTSNTLVYTQIDGKWALDLHFTLLLIPFSMLILPFLLGCFKYTSMRYGHFTLSFFWFLDHL